MTSEIKTEAKMLDSYFKRKELYDNFASSIKELLGLLLKSKKIRFLEITCRSKDIMKLKEKIERKRQKGRIYKSIEEVSDLAGVRVILYFKDDIDRVIRLVEHEFKVNQRENLDKEKEVLSSPDKFGYLAKHRIVTLRPKRQKLGEYKRFKGLKCEIQVRTILQHAWAEIEHDIGYKPKIDEKSRSGSRLRRLLSENAALLEVADDRFVEIRKKSQAIKSKEINKSG